MTHYLEDGSECDCLRVFVCKLCNEEIEPGSLPNKTKEFIPGRTEYRLNIFDVPLVDAFQWMRISFRTENVFGFATRLELRSSDELTDRTASVSFGVTSLGFRERVPGWKDD